MFTGDEGTNPIRCLGRLMAVATSGQLGHASRSALLKEGFAAGLALCGSAGLVDLELEELEEVCSVFRLLLRVSDGPVLREDWNACRHCSDVVDNALKCPLLANVLTNVHAVAALISVEDKNSK
jgi:hypothetical protein